MTGWLITAGILFLLAILPLGVSVRYNADGAQVQVTAGPVWFTVFPGKKKEDKPSKPKKQKEPKKQKKASETTEKKQKKGGSMTALMPLVQAALDFLDDFRRKLRVKRLELKVIMAGDDPAELAINYGRAWAGIGNLFPLLERVFVIRKRNVAVECDFTAQETTVLARLEISITFGRLLYLVVRYGVRGMMILQKTRKGGASK